MKLLSKGACTSQACCVCEYEGNLSGIPPACGQGFVVGSSEIRADPVERFH